MRAKRTADGVRLALGVALANTILLAVGHR